MKHGSVKKSKMPAKSKKSAAMPPAMPPAMKKKMTGMMGKKKGMM